MIDRVICCYPCPGVLFRYSCSFLWRTITQEGSFAQASVSLHIRHCRETRLCQPIQPCQFHVHWGGKEAGESGAKIQWAGFLNMFLAFGGSVMVQSRRSCVLLQVDQRFQISESLCELIPLHCSPALGCSESAYVAKAHRGRVVLSRQFLWVQLAGIDQRNFLAQNVN